MIKKTNSFQQKKEAVNRAWQVVDVEGKVLGQIATKIAQLLIGKHKTTFTPHVDGGDYVIVLNATKVVVTGNKVEDKMYHRHSQYPGGLKSISFRDQMVKDPTRIIRSAVKGMLPKNKQQDPRLKRLKVFAGTEHPYTAQVKKA